MKKLDNLIALDCALMHATRSGLLDELSAGYLDPDGVNRFCDAVSAMVKQEAAGHELPKDDIIAHSPWFNRGGATAICRLVVRDLGHEFVVHTQYRYSDGSFAFGDGHYFRARNGDRHLAAREAIARFAEKFASWMAQYAVRLD